MVKDGSYYKENELFLNSVDLKLSLLLYAGGRGVGWGIPLTLPRTLVLWALLIFQSIWERSKVKQELKTSFEIFLTCMQDLEQVLCHMYMSQLLACSSSHPPSLPHLLYAPEQPHLPCAPNQPHLCCFANGLHRLLVCNHLSYLSYSAWEIPC